MSGASFQPKFPLHVSSTDLHYTSYYTVLICTDTRCPCPCLSSLSSKNTAIQTSTYPHFASSHEIFFSHYLRYISAYLPCSLLVLWLLKSQLTLKNVRYVGPLDCTVSQTKVLHNGDKFGARILEIKVNDANSSDEEGGNLEWVPVSRSPTWIWGNDEEAKTKSREL